MRMLAKLAWFGCVGGAATLSYAAIAYVLKEQFGWLPALASAMAYVICGVGSFAGHKLLTFRSQAPAGGEIGKFAATSLLGLGVALMVPYGLTQVLQWDARIAIALVCVLCPLLNFILLSLFVFGKAGKFSPAG